jgi:menaquinone-dependent protoporphyrinogen oxidase
VQPSQLGQWPFSRSAQRRSPTDEKEWQGSREQIERELAQFPWLKPVALELFGGKFPEKLTFPHTLLPALKNMPASDIRDWTAIRAWASNLAASLQPGSCHRRARHV